MWKKAKIKSETNMNEGLAIVLSTVLNLTSSVLTRLILVSFFVLCDIAKQAHDIRYLTLYLLLTIGRSAQGDAGVRGGEPRVPHEDQNQAVPMA